MFDAAEVSVWLGAHGLFIGILLIRSIVGRFTGV